MRHFVQSQTAPFASIGDTQRSDAPCLCYTEIMPTRTTDWSRITAVSKAATSRCGGSSAHDLLGGSVEAATNCTTSTVLSLLDTRMIKLVIDYTAGSTYWREHSNRAAARISGPTGLRVHDDDVF
jgi:hypothetical protein